MKRKIDRATAMQLVCGIAIIILFINIVVKLSMIASAAVAPVQPNEVIRQKYGTYIDEIADRYGICPELIEAIIECESSGQADAVSSSGCIGLMQVSPEWHIDRMAKLGVCDLFDPYTNILVATDYLTELFETYEDLPMVLMVYNGSSDAYKRWESGNYTEYATWIMERSAELEREGSK